jgi:lysophospholipid hydrolase
MLLDGGYFNNVPADIMRNLGAKVIVAVDVGSLDDTRPTTYGDKLSGWWLLFRRFIPFQKDYGPIPTLSDIQSRLAYACSVPLREAITKMDDCFYFAPPVTHFGTMQFEKILEIEKIGYDYAKKQIDEWNEKGILEEQFGVILEKQHPFARRASI